MFSSFNLRITAVPCISYYKKGNGKSLKEYWINLIRRNKQLNRANGRFALPSLFFTIENGIYWLLVDRIQAIDTLIDLSLYLTNVQVRTNKTYRYKNLDRNGYGVKTSTKCKCHTRVMKRLSRAG